jgi:hypothetical protein
LAAVLTGCSKGGGEGGNVTLNSMVQKLSGPAPSQLVAWAFDPNDPDRRRQGVVGLSSKDWGLKEPYLKGYAALLKTDKDPLVRAAAVRALGRAQDPNYAPDITRALMDTDVTVRQDAATALDKVHDDNSATSSSVSSRPIIMAPRTGPWKSLVTMAREAISIVPNSVISTPNTLDSRL